MKIAITEVWQSFSLAIATPSLPGFETISIEYQLRTFYIILYVIINKALNRNNQQLDLLGRK